MTRTKTALIYERIRPVTAEAYGRASVDLGRDFRFAEGLQAVPALAEEFASLAQICPIVFAGDVEAPLPNALLSLQQDKNVFIGPNGGWAAPYIPAFLRRYPFISAASKGKDRPVLCIDDAFSGLNRENRGQKLFAADGTPTRFLSDVTAFVGRFDASLAATRAFVARLQEHDLLEPMAIRIRGKDGAPMAQIGGLLGIAQARFEALAPETRAALEESGDLERCTLHLKSLEHIRNARKRAAGSAQ